MDAVISETVGDILVACGAENAQSVGGGLWKIGFAAGTPFVASAVVEEQWLAVEADLATAACPERAEQLQGWLEQNAALGAGAKLVLMPGDFRLRLRADVPLGEGESPVALGRLAGMAMKEALGRLAGGEVGVQAGGAGAGGPEEDGGSISSLETLCEEAGWRFSRRGSQSLAVALDGPDGSCQAILARRRGLIKIRVHLGCCEGAGEASACALALMLLTVGGAVRMVKPTAEREGGRTLLGYEVSLPDSAMPGQLDRALSALSVACRQCGPREVQALLDESVAQKYFAVRGWSL